MSQKQKIDTSSLKWGGSKCGETNEKQGEINMTDEIMNEIRKRLGRKERERFVLEGNEDFTEVIKRRCICKYELGYLTKEEVKAKRVENKKCDDCGRMAYGSGLICSSSYVQWAPTYSHKYSEKLVQVLEEEWGIECLVSKDDGEAIEDCISIGTVNNGVFVINHSLGGRDGPVSSNWASPAEFSNQYRSKGELNIRYKQFWRSVDGKVVEELFLDRFGFTDYIERGGQYYAKSLDDLTQEEITIPCEIDATIGGNRLAREPLEICTAWNLEDLSVATVNKKIDQMSIQVDVMDADAANLVLISRNNSRSLKFAFIKISREQLTHWANQKTQILNSSFRNKEQQEISVNLSVYENIFQNGRLNLQKGVRLYKEGNELIVNEVLEEPGIFECPRSEEVMA